MHMIAPVSAGSAMAVEDGADVIESVRLERRDGSGEDHALFEREGVALAEIRQPAAVVRQAEILLDLPGVLDVVGSSASVAAEALA
jgi:hypothetical protein